MSIIVKKVSEEAATASFEIKTYKTVELKSGENSEILSETMQVKFAQLERQKDNYQSRADEIQTQIDACLAST